MNEKTKNEQNPCRKTAEKEKNGSEASQTGTEPSLEYC